MKPLLALLCLLLITPAHALILVQKGNAPTTDHDWPAGSVDLANLKQRAGFWEGPPFGGGRYVFEYAGDTEDMQQALDLFAKIKSPELRVIVHEGKNTGFFFGDGKDKAGPSMDFSFTVWTPANYERLYGGKGGVAIISAADPSGNLGKSIEPPTIDVYLGAGHIDWKKVKVPANLKVIDERATANGYAPADGSVCRGQVFEMEGGKPLAGATVRSDTFSGTTDADGKFEIKKIPAGSVQVVADAPGYASRIFAHASFGSDTLKEYPAVKLAKAARVAGVVKDQDGKVVPNATVRGQGLVAADGTGYIVNQGLQVTADADGKFAIEGLPAGGSLHFYTYSKAHAPVDILTAHKLPAEDLELRVVATGSIKVTVVNAKGKPDPSAQIAIYPEGGSKAGKWSASANLDANATYTVGGVPPGRYTVSPFPALHIDKKPDPAAKTIEVKAGQTAEVEVIK